MSDRPLADDWWLASDGKWYPPQSRQYAAPPPPGAPSQTSQAYPAYQQRRYASNGLTGTLMAFAIAAGAISILTGILRFAVWGLWQDLQAGGSTTFTDIDDMTVAADGAAVFWALLAFVTYILLIIWTSTAYNSAASRGATERKWSSGWAVGGWFIPFANAVIPKLVINEIDRMSLPDLAEPIGATWRSQQRTAISDWGWTLAVIGYVVFNLGGALSQENVDYLTMEAIGNIVLGVGFILGGIAALRIGTRLRA